MAAAITQNKGGAKFQSFPKTASTALTANWLVTLTSGKLVAPASSTLVFAGILPRAVVAADDDYALANEVPVQLLNLNSTYLMTTSGASAATHVGNAYDISDGGTLNLSGTSYKQFVVERVLSSTLVEVKPNIAVITVL